MTDPQDIAAIDGELTEAQTFEVDDRGLFCRHCGRASWRHYRVRGVGNLCVDPATAVRSYLANHIDGKDRA